MSVLTATPPTPTIGLLALRAQLQDIPTPPPLRSSPHSLVTKKAAKPHLDPPLPIVTSHSPLKRSPSRHSLSRNSVFCEGIYIPTDLASIPIPSLLDKVSTPSFIPAVDPVFDIAFESIHYDNSPRDGSLSPDTRESSVEEDEEAALRRDAAAAMDWSSKGPWRSGRNGRGVSGWGGGLSTIIEQRSIAEIEGMMGGGHREQASEAGPIEEGKGKEKEGSAIGLGHGDRMKTSYGWLDELEADDLWPSLYKTKSLPSLHLAASEDGPQTPKRSMSLNSATAAANTSLGNTLGISDSPKQAFSTTIIPRQRSNRRSLLGVFSSIATLEPEDSISRTTSSATNRYQNISRHGSTRPYSEATTLVGSVRENRRLRDMRRAGADRHPISTVRRIVTANEMRHDDRATQPRANSRSPVAPNLRIPILANRSNGQRGAAAESSSGLLPPLTLNTAARVGNQRTSPEMAVEAYQMRMRRRSQIIMSERARQMAREKEERELRGTEEADGRNAIELLGKGVMACIKSIRDCVR